MRLGALETTAVTHLPEHAASFLRRFPEVDLSVNTDDTHSLVQQVLDHKVDGAFVYGPVEYMDIKQIPVSHEELVLISPEEGVIEDMLRLPMLFLEPAALIAIGSKDYWRKQVFDSKKS